MSYCEHTDREWYDRPHGYREDDEDRYETYSCTKCGCEYPPESMAGKDLCEYCRDRLAERPEEEE